MAFKKLLHATCALVIGFAFIACSTNATGAASITTTSSSSGVGSSQSQASSQSVGASITDVRDGKTYRTVVIGAKTWMAENLNYTPATGKSWCPNDTVAYCASYGRLYEWAVAKVACPVGWHLPDTTEWNALVASVGDTATAGTKLKANSNLWLAGKGTDNFGFSAVPAGLYNGSSYMFFGYYGEWWTADTEGSYGQAYRRVMTSNQGNVSTFTCSQNIGLSVRCVKD